MTKQSVTARQMAVFAQVCGLIVVALGVGLLVNWPAGVIALGAGFLLLGVAQEMSR